MENNGKYIQVNEYYLLREQSKAKSCIGYFSVSEKKEKLGKLFFVKKVPLSDKETLKEHQAESQLLNTEFLNHPNIIRCVDRSIQSKNNHYFVYEYCELPNLSDFFKLYKNTFYAFPSQRVIQKILRGISSAISKMHSENVIHRELKLKYIKFKYNNLNEILQKCGKDGIFFGENNEISKTDSEGSDPNVTAFHNIKGAGSHMKEIVSKLKNEDLTEFLKNYWVKFKGTVIQKDFDDFFVKNVDVKIIDLGHAKMVDSDEASSIDINQTFIKTDFCAPEMNLKQKYGFSSDMWPIGAIALYLLTGKCKGIDLEKDELEIGGKIECSVELIDFINCLLQKDPKKRLNYKNILNHPFLRKNVENFEMKKFEKRIKITKIENEENVPVMIGNETKQEEEKKEKEVEIQNEVDEPIWNDLILDSEKQVDVNEVFLEKKDEKEEFCEFGYDDYVNETGDRKGEESKEYSNKEKSENVINQNGNERTTEKNLNNDDVFEIVNDYMDEMFSRKIVKIGEVKLVDEIEFN